MTPSHAKKQTMNAQLKHIDRPSDPSYNGITAQSPHLGCRPPFMMNHCHAMLLLPVHHHYYYHHHLLLLLLVVVREA